MTVYALGSGVQGSPGRIGRMRMSNRARTQAEMSARFLAGVPEADRGASNTPVYTSDFSAGVDSWVAGASGRTITGNIDSINGSDNWARVERTGATGAMSVVRPLSGGVTAINRRTTITIFNPSGSGITHFNVGVSDAVAVALASQVVAVAENTQVTATVNYSTSLNSTDAFVSPSTSLGIQRSDLATGKLFYFKSYTLEKTGLTADYAPSAIQLAPGQWHDRANKKHFHVPDGFRLGNPETDGDLLFTNTWSASDTLQYGNNVNSNILATTACVYDIIIVPSASYAGGFQIGNGSNNAYYGTVTGPVVAGVPIRVGLNTLVPDANRKLTIKPTAAYTGNVKTSVFVKTLEA